jgi:hypothetical protein
MMIQKLNLAIVTRNPQAFKSQYPAKPNVITQINGTITPPMYQLVESEAMGTHRL